MNHCIYLPCLLLQRVHRPPAKQESRRLGCAPNAENPRSEVLGWYWEDQCHSALLEDFRQSCSQYWSLTEPTTLPCIYIS